jgi:hypothetical protein
MLIMIGLHLCSPHLFQRLKLWPIIRRFVTLTRITIDHPKLVLKSFLWSMLATWRTTKSVETSAMLFFLINKQMTE